ncbi:DUF3025 domain-containing protein [Povalibacter sp.]|uniref:DUF3025 domain-containing protein n=1 Tax=Povalibacter sp. TaxID=1962978 RepID=UPI002F41ADB8
MAQLAQILQHPPPWMSPYLTLARRLLQGGASQSVAGTLNAAADNDVITVRFVDQADLPAGEAYEAFIARTSCVPTRDNPHDLFNGLMWLAWPRTKRRLNLLQAEQLALRGSSGPRGTLRDALTLFDENAAMLQAPEELVDALRRRDWHTLFVTRREQWQSARLMVFGHALMEKLLQPRKAITAHVWVVGQLTDDALTASLTTERLLARPFLPLPVLGIPGWWSANEEPGFYDDAAVFRPAR